MLFTIHFYRRGAGGYFNVASCEVTAPDMASALSRIMAGIGAYGSPWPHDEPPPAPRDAAVIVGPNSTVTVKLTETGWWFEDE